MERCECGFMPKKGDCFCRQCGYELPQQDSFLCECGAEVNKDDNFCHACGTKFEGIEEDLELKEKTCSTCGSLY